MNRAMLTKIHLLLAAFMFPVALMYLITGGFYTWGIKGSYDSQTYDVVLADALTEDAAQLTALTEVELQKLGIPVPSGGAKIKKIGVSYQLEWTGSDRDVILAPGSAELVAQLTVKDTNSYRHFVQLHKAKGGQLFKVYAAFLAVSLFTILLSGFLMAWQVPKLRRLATICAATGAALFLVMVSTN